MQTNRSHPMALSNAHKHLTNLLQGVHEVQALVIAQALVTGLCATPVSTSIPTRNALLINPSVRTRKIGLCFTKISRQDMFFGGWEFESRCELFFFRQNASFFFSDVFLSFLPLDVADFCHPEALGPVNTKDLLNVLRTAFDQVAQVPKNTRKKKRV